MGGLTRRRLIGGAAAGAAGAALPIAAQAQAAGRRESRTADVAVVGAGLAGLMAAVELKRAGRSVVVLEARDRVGGRVLNRSIGGGEIVEVGGQWIGPTQNRIMALAGQLGVERFKTYNTGKNIYHRQGTNYPYEPIPPLGSIPPDPGAAEVGAVIQDLNQKAEEVGRDEPWNAEKAPEYDGKTFETYKNEMTATPGAEFLLSAGIEAIFACEPRDLSLLFVVFYTAAAGNESNPGKFERLIDTAGGAQEERFVGGSGLLARKMAQRLRRQVVLGAPVRRILQEGGRVRVQSDRVEVVAKRAIVAIPPALTAAIDFKPALPADRAQLVQRFPQGTVIKCQALYDRPFWRDDGFTGQAVSDADPIRFTFDNSPPDGSPGVMLGFIEGHTAREWARRPAAERRQAVIANFVTLFGPHASQPLQYMEMQWSKEVWTRGCYVGYTAPGVLLDYGPFIRAPVGRVHWAGTETSPIWNGYMEGAIRSGERAAAEVLSAGLGSRAASTAAEADALARA